MATDHAETIVNHHGQLRCISDWKFHGPSLERIVCKAVDDARADAVLEDRAAQQAAAKSALEDR